MRVGVIVMPVRLEGIWNLKKLDLRQPKNTLHFVSISLFFVISTDLSVCLNPPFGHPALILYRSYFK
jgi:hypothetical protein